MYTCCIRRAKCISNSSLADFDFVVAHVAHVKENTISGSFNDDEVKKQMKLSAAQCGCNASSFLSLSISFIVVTMVVLVVLGV